MYCPKCGNDVKAGLNFCNSCGYRIEDDTKSDSGKIVRSLSKALGWIGAIGFGSFIPVVIALLESSMEHVAVIAIAFIYLAALFGICFYIMSLIKTLHLGEKETQESKEQNFQMPTEKQGRNTNQLEPARTPPASVTELTTRILEKVPVEIKKGS